MTARLEAACFAVIPAMTTMTATIIPKRHEKEAVCSRRLGATTTLREGPYTSNVWATRISILRCRRAKTLWREALAPAAKDTNPICVHPCSSVSPFYQFSDPGPGLTHQPKRRRSAALSSHSIGRLRRNDLQIQLFSLFSCQHIRVSPSY